MATTVLIVDEDARLVATLVTALARSGYVAMGAQTFGDARRMLRASDPAVLIAGVRLGPYNGLHLLLRGRGERPQMKVIVLGIADRTIEKEALALGASAYMSKPVTVEAVLAEVGALAPLFPAAARDNDAQASRAATSLVEGYLPA